MPFLPTQFYQYMPVPTHDAFYGFLSGFRYLVETKYPSMLGGYSLVYGQYIYLVQ